MPFLPEVEMKFPIRSSLSIYAAATYVSFLANFFSVVSFFASFVSFLTDVVFSFLVEFLLAFKLTFPGGLDILIPVFVGAVKL